MGQKGEATRRQILAAAWELFARQGYTKTTMQELCLRCGLSKGGLYRHYQDKAEVFTDLLHALQAQETQRETRGMAQDAPAALLLEGYLQHVAEELQSTAPGIQRALYEFCVEHKGDVGPALLAAQYRRGEEALLRLLAYGAARGEWRVPDPPGTAAAILFLVEGLQMAKEVMPLAPQTVQGALGQIRRLLEAADEI